MGRAKGFAAAKVPLGMAATSCCMLGGARGTIWVVIDEANVGGRSRRKSGTKGFDDSGVSRNETGLANIEQIIPPAHLKVDSV